MALRSELEENPLAPPIDEEFQQYRDRFETEQEFHEAVKVWPRCPQCGKRRITRCPICRTSSDVFPLGDPEFWNAESRKGKTSRLLRFLQRTTINVRRVGISFGS